MHTNTTVVHIQTYTPSAHRYITKKTHIHSATPHISYLSSKSSDLRSLIRPEFPFEVLLEFWGLLTVLDVLDSNEESLVLYLRLCGILMED